MKNIVESIIKLQKMIDNSKNIEEFEFIESYKELIDKQLDQIKVDLQKQIDNKKSDLVVNVAKEYVKIFDKFLNKITS